MSAVWMSEAEYARLINKQRNLPAQLARARRRVQQLEAECVHYGMKELLENPDLLNKAWEREVALAKARNTECE